MASGLPIGTLQNIIGTISNIVWIPSKFNICVHP